MSIQLSAILAGRALTSWRTCLAQFFDSPDFMPYLSRIDQIDINYEAPDNNAHPNFSEALLLVAWLAHQLGWQPAFSMQSRGSDASLILNQAGAPLTVNMHGHNDRVDEIGGISGIKIVASRPTDDPDTFKSATFTIALNEAYDHATTSVEQTGSIPIVRNVLFAKPDRTDLLRDNLALVQVDRVYAAALELAGQFNSAK